MADRIASGEIHIDVNDGNAHSKLAALRADYHRTMEQIDREEATATIDGDIKPLRAAVARAKKELAQFEDDTPTVELSAKSARLKDELRRARVEVKKLQAMKAEVELKGDSHDLDNAIAAAAAKVKALDAQSADVELKVSGYENLRRNLANAEKGVKQFKRAQADAARRRADLVRTTNDRIDALEEQQYKRSITRVKRESKVREDAARLQEQTAGSIAKLRNEYERGMGFHYKGYQGNLIRQLSALNDARQKAGDNSKKLQELEMREVRIRENLAAVTRKLRQFEQFKSDDDRIKRELEEVPKLEAAYGKLIRRMEQLDAAHRKAALQRNDQKAFDIELQARDLEHQINNMRREITRRTGREPLVFQADAKLSARAGERLRRDFVASNGNPFEALIRSSFHAGETAADRVQRGFTNRWRRGFRGNGADLGSVLTGSVVRGFDRLRQFGEGLTDATVRLGPFTTSIRKAVGGIALFSPILVDVVGAMGALVGVAGSAVVGVGALGLAVGGGAIPAFLGMGLVMKDVVQQFASVKKAQKAYDDAVLKNGKNSTQAQKKLSELQNVMGGVSKETARQVLSARSLGKAWDQATAPGRAAVWKAIGQSIKTGTDLMPMFAKNTNESLNVAERGWTRWMQALRSSEGRAVLNTMMANFNRSLGPALSGLGRFAAYLGKVGAVASQSLPGLSNTFNHWAKDLNDSADGSHNFVRGIKNTITSAKDVGNVFRATGRVTKAFFSAGVNDGQKFSRTLAQTMDRWAAGFESREGRRQLQQFFAESIDGAKSLYHFLAPIATTFVGWARALSPIARGFFDGAAAVGRFVQAIAEATAMQSPLAALAATLGTLWAIGKIGGAAAAVGRFITALFGIRGGATAAAAAEMRLAEATAAAAGGEARAAAAGNALAASNARVAESAAAAAAAQGRMAASGAAAGAAGGIGAARAGMTVAGRNAAFGAAALGAGAARAAGPVTRLARVGTVATRALSGLGAATIGVGSVMGGLTTLAIGAGAALYLYHNRTRESEKATKRMNDATKSSLTTLGTLTDGNLQLASAVVQAKQSTSDLRSTQRSASAEQKRLTQLQRQGKTATQEYKDLQAQHKQTLLQLASARLNDIAVQRQTVAAAKNEREAIKQTVIEADKARQASMDRSASYADEHKNDLKGYKEVEQAAKRTGKSMERTAWEMFGTRGDDVLKTGREYKDMLNDQAKAMRFFTDVQQKAVLEQANLKRALAGLGPIAQSHAAAFAQLGQKIQKALSAGYKNKYGQNIQFADSKQAASAANAAAAISKSAGKAAGQKIVLRILADSRSAEEALRRLRAAKVTDKKLKIISQGGEKAVHTLEDIAGRKLTPKEAKIVSRGGPQAEAMIRKIAGAKIADKYARIIAKDLASAIAKGIKKLIDSVKSKAVTISATTAGTGAVATLASYVNGLHDKSININANYTSSGRKPGVTAAAGSANIGTGVETASTQRAIDRAVERGSRGMLPTMSSAQAQRGQRFQGARMIVGEEPRYHETVISENPSYRKSNIEALKAAAAALGVKAFASGKKNKPFKAGRRATSAEKTKQSRVAEKRIKKGSKGKAWTSPSAQAELSAVDAGFAKKKSQEFDIQRAEGKLKEPESFVKVTGQDAQGNDIVEVDQGAVQSWSGDLNRIASMYQDLVNVILDLQNNLIPKAESAVKSAKQTALNNIGPLTNAIKREDDIINGKRVKNVAKDEARARKAIYTRELKENRKVKEDADGDLESLKERRDGLEEERLTAEDSRDSYREEAGAVAGKASTAQADANKSHADNMAAQAAGTGDYAPGGQYGPPTEDQKLQTTLDNLNLEGTLAGLGQTFKGQPLRTQDQINADKKSTAQQMIDKGNAWLQDSNPNNDDAARGLISTGASTLQEILGSSPTAAGLQSAFDSANSLRDDLYKQFGGNLISRGGTIADLMLGQSNVLRGSDMSGAQGGGDKNIYLQPTFKMQPSDPHLWARDVAFELSAAI